MPRKNPPRPPIRPLNSERVRSMRKVETKRGHRFEVHYSKSSDHEYQCAGCHKIIGIGSNTYTVIDLDHILGEQAGIDERRHWHIDCWRLFR